MRITCESDLPFITDCLKTQTTLQEASGHLNEVVKLLLAERTMRGKTLLLPKQLRRHLHRLSLIRVMHTHIFIRKPHTRLIFEHLPEWR